MATTGLPAASASTTARGSPSKRDVSVTTVAASSTAGMSRRQPGQVQPILEARRTALRLEPPPQLAVPDQQEVGVRKARRPSAAASATKRSGAFCGLRQETWTTSGTVGADPQLRPHRVAPGGVGGTPRGRCRSG